MKDAAHASVERIMGIEPTYAAWEAAVLPMNYIRVAALPDLHGGTAPRAASAFLWAALMDVGRRMLWIAAPARRWWAMPELNRLMDRGQT